MWLKLFISVRTLSCYLQKVANVYKDQAAILIPECKACSAYKATFRLNCKRLYLITSAVQICFNSRGENPIFFPLYKYIYFCWAYKWVSACQPDSPFLTLYEWIHQKFACLHWNCLLLPAWSSCHKKLTWIFCQICMQIKIWHLTLCVHSSVRQSFVESWDLGLDKLP